jgi:D-glycero-D-manno-heptose 1,7-bisphosphate phosphatase
LDRDGVINYDYNYIYKIKDFIWRPGVKKAIKLLNKKNYLVIVVSNQAGVAHGFFKEKHVKNLTNYINKDLVRMGAHIDKFYYCFYHPKAKIKKYKKKSIFRKPGAGMISQAFKEFSIYKKKSFFIGDRATDKICAKKKNIRFYYAKSDLLTQLKKILGK